MLAHKLKINHKTRRPPNSKYSFSSLYLAIGSYKIGDREAETVTELLCSEIEIMIFRLKSKKSSQKKEITAKNKVNAESFFSYAYGFFIEEKRDPNISCANRCLLDFADIAFPQNNECFDGEIGFLTCLDGENAMLVWKDFETKRVLSLLIKFDDYIEIWNKSLVELKNNLSQ